MQIVDLWRRKRATCGMKLKASSFLFFFSLSVSQAEPCDDLCDLRWWMVANQSGLAKQLVSDAGANARDVSGLTPLHYAAALAGAPLVGDMLATGSMVNARNLQGVSPLHLAASHGRGSLLFVIAVNVEDAYRIRMDALWPDVRDTLRPLRQTVGTIRREISAPDQLRVRIGQPEGLATGISALRELARPVVASTRGLASSLDISGANDLIVITLSAPEREATSDRTMEEMVEIIRRRFEEVGAVGLFIQRRGRDRLLINVPALGNAEELRRLIGTTGRLTFQPVVSRTSDPSTRPGARQEVLPSMDEDGIYYVLEKAAVVSGEDLLEAQPSFDQNGRPVVSFRFNPSGARRFGDYTAVNVGSSFAIVLDGNVISVPVIPSHNSSGSGIISGSFTIEEATELAALMRAGALAVDQQIVETETIQLDSQRERDALVRIEILVNAGADIDAADSMGRTPLHYAAATGFTKGILLLLDAGANFNAQDIRGNTPLHLGTERTYVDSVNALLSAGADGGIQNNAGQTPFDLLDASQAGSRLYWLLSDARFD